MTPFRRVRGSTIAPLTDRSKNPRWAKLEREVIGKYLDAYAHQWSKVDNFHKDKDNIREFGRKYGDVYGDLERQYRRKGYKPSRRQVLKALASGGGSDRTPRYPGAKYGNDSTLDDLVSRVVSSKNSRERSVKDNFRDRKEQKHEMDRMYGNVKVQLKLLGDLKELNVKFPETSCTPTPSTIRICKS